MVINKKIKINKIKKNISNNKKKINIKFNLLFNYNNIKYTKITIIYKIIYWSFDFKVILI